MSAFTKGSENLVVKKDKKIKSVVWNWYDFAVSDVDQITPRCKVCLKAVSAKDSSTTNLFQHLANNHKSDWEQCDVLRAAHEDKTPSKTPPPAPKQVALLDVNETAGKSLNEALDKQYGQQRTLFLKCNVQSEEEIKVAFRKTVETFGGIDILCNNAGILDEAEWEKTVSINLMAVIRLSYLALEHMNKLTGGRGGVIVNTASMAGLVPFISCPVYTATKHGVVGFTRAMAAASKASGYGVRFNALCPSFVQTDLALSIPFKLGSFSHLADSTQQLMEKLGWLNVSEVAECLLELVTNETKNGAAFMVKSTGNEYTTFPVFDLQLL